MIELQEVVAGLLSILVVIGGVIWRKLSRMEEKLDLRVEKPDCEKQQSRCHEEFTDLWNAVGRHSHTGLTSDSRVTR